MIPFVRYIIDINTNHTLYFFLFNFLILQKLWDF